jgi:hypothetical protein
MRVFFENDWTQQETGFKIWPSPMNMGYVYLE